ncbi:MULTISPECIES: helix-turn-helix domain-containing protein [Streptomyces]|uniref:Transcriptional regulator with XRE-family HTH domain n=1 Tax=Streptomyces clavifer TaxID=68188 RepID=A0ABS4VHI0_9ACTN|nr:MULTISPECIES: helix-turn-helix transcriptional regulator [Streptomyces]KQX91640.1 DNA-binding protein [Streptomyces sp. Root1319]KQZ20200.1 DNA-binding protein [Streptomyces sp. Root55]MBP2363084.1 transcriptional regulator with XRE-family HTH domain [Streptomyces clavifer]MDX2743050.1 helix-turn-helix transcriptional regulator [Streptomyces sp. NRRL_B-2557]MDX3061219.1 helix-turn-helix transcriptional regulator [Streptomyces sp. ND04-05B]
MRPRSGPTVEHRVLAARLRMLRERAGVSLQAAAEALDAHPATVRRIERAETGLDARQVRVLLDRYGVPAAEAEPVMAGLGTANLPGWWHRWRGAMEPWQQEVIGIESSAGLVRTWHPALVPELLRTPDYAAALCRILYPAESPAQRTRRVELLGERQRRMAERGAALWALFPAAALHTRVGGPEVMAGQRALLTEAADRPHVTVQVVPLDFPPHPMTGVPPLHLMRVPAPEIADCAVLETPGARVEITDEPDTVMQYRIRLDSACASAPHPGSPLPGGG